MQVNNAASASRKASLNKRIILSEVGRVDISGGSVVRQELPANRETEDVETVILNKVHHLAKTVCAIILSEWRPRSACRAVTVCVASEVEACDIDTCELEFTSTGRSGAGGAAGWSASLAGGCGRDGGRSAGRGSTGYTL